MPIEAAVTFAAACAAPVVLLAVLIARDHRDRRRRRRTAAPHDREGRPVDRPSRETTHPPERK